MREMADKIRNLKMDPKRLAVEAKVTEAAVLAVLAGDDVTEGDHEAIKVVTYRVPVAVAVLNGWASVPSGASRQFYADFMQRMYPDPIG
jgi:hypothetical protein